MTQQINLYQPQFRARKRSLVSSATLPLLLGAVVAVMAAAYGEAYRQRAQLRVQAALVETALKQEQELSQQLAARHAAAKKSPELEAEVAQLEQRRKTLDENVAAMAGGALGDTNGYSEYLRAFARQSLNGLWLTGFTIAGAGAEVVIDGRTLNAELVPTYIRRLGQEPVLSGRAFAALQIARPKPPETTERAAQPPYLEFTLATTDPSAAKAGGASVASAAATGRGAGL